MFLALVVARRAWWCLLCRKEGKSWGESRLTIQCVVFEGILEEGVVGFGRMGVCKFWMGEAVWACAFWRESGGGKLGLANDAGGVR